MAKYEINVKVSSSATGGGAEPTRSQIRENKQSIKEAQARVQAVTRGGATDRRSPEVKLITSIQKLDNTLSKLAISIEKMSKGLGPGRPAAGGRGGGEASGGRGRGGRIGGAAGMGRLGGAIGIAGIPVAAAGYLMSKVLQIGRASLAESLTQLPTAGVAGFQSRGVKMGGYGIMTMAEKGQYIKARRMAAGRSDVGEGEYERSYMGWRKNKETGEKERVKKYKSTPSVAMKYAAGFGIAGAEMAKTVGYMDVMTGGKGKGEQAFQQAIAQTFYKERGKIKSLETALPEIFNRLQEVLGEMVKGGIKSNDAARDMVLGIREFARSSPNRSVVAGIEVQRNIMGIQKRAAEGQFGGLPEWMMMQTALAQLEKKDVRDWLVGEGAISKKQAGNKAGMSAQARQFAAEHLLSKGTKEIRDLTIDRYIEQFGGLEGDPKKRMQSFHRIAQEFGITKNTAQSMTLFDTYERRQAPKKYKNLRDKESILEWKLEKSKEDKGMFSSIKRFVGLEPTTKDIAKELETTQKEMEYQRKLIGGRKIKPEEQTSKMTDEANKMIRTKSHESHGRDIRMKEILLTGPALQAQKTVIILEQSFSDMAKIANKMTGVFEKINSYAAKTAGSLEDLGTVVSDAVGYIGGKIDEFKTKWNEAGLTVW